MRTLTDHNKFIMREKQKITKGAMVLCPECKGAEMEYEKWPVILTSIPPKIKVKCPECNHTGFKIL